MREKQDERKVARERVIAAGGDGGLSLLLSPSRVREGESEKCEGMQRREMGRESPGVQEAGTGDWDP